MKQWTEEELINDGNRLRNAEITNVGRLFRQTSVLDNGQGKNMVCLPRIFYLTYPCLFYDMGFYCLAYHLCNTRVESFRHNKFIV